MDLPELQIDDILRYLGEDDNQESAPFPPTPNVPTSSHQPSSPSTCRITLNSRMATPFQGQRGSAKLYYSNHTYTKRATRDGCHIWRCRNRKCKGSDEDTTWQLRSVRNYPTQFLHSTHRIRLPPDTIRERHSLWWVSSYYTEPHGSPWSSLFQETLRPKMEEESKIII